MNKHKNRTTTLDFKLYRYYHGRKTASADLQRMKSKAAAMCEWSTFFLMNSLAEEQPSISMEQVSIDSANAPPGDDYHSIIISKPPTTHKHEYSREYIQDASGNIHEAHGGIHIADDPEIFHQPQPHETTTQTPTSNQTAADEYIPLKIPSPKTGRLVNHPSRSFVHRDTGEVISRRQHMYLRGIVPEIPASERGTYTRLIISYGVTTHE